MESPEVICWRGGNLKKTQMLFLHRNDSDIISLLLSFHDDIETHTWSSQWFAVDVVGGDSGSTGGRHGAAL